MMDMLANFQSRFNEAFAADQCWRCSDDGALQSASIVPRLFPCLCEEGQSAVEGAGYLKRVQVPRPRSGEQA